MTVYGYARVSTAGQAAYGNSLEDQIAKLSEAGATEIYSEHYTGTKMNRPEFDKVTALLKSGDTLIVTKLDRFARTAADGYTTIKDLMDKGVSVNVLNMGLVNNTTTGVLLLQILLAFAEFERNMIVERTTSGKEIARQRPDYREGRPAVSDDTVAKIKAGISYTELGISRSVWYKYKAMN